MPKSILAAISDYYDVSMEEALEMCNTGEYDDEEVEEC